MLNSEFIIPLNIEGLVNPTEARQYSVQEVFTNREIVLRLQGCQAKFGEHGCRFILGEFDVFYSIIRHFNELHESARDEAWQLLLKSCQQLQSELTMILDEDCMDSEKRNDTRNIFKMSVYLLCHFAHEYEERCLKPTPEAVIAGGRGRKKAISNKVASIWESERDKMTQVLYLLCQQPFHILWDPPVAEEEFISLATNCCYKILENPSINRNKNVKETIFRILGHMIKKHSHSIGCGLKIIQLLQQYEHVTSLLAQAVAMFVEEFGAKSIVGDILREIGQMDGKEITRDSSGTRNIGTFLVELSELIPSILLNNISILVLHLDQESYSLRNTVLGVITEIVLKLLSKAHLESKEKLTRDQLLDHLEDHMHDVNAFVRSRVLQLWQRLVEEKSVPLPRQQRILKIAIGRLHDKSANVRKYSMQLITALLQSNPYAAKLSSEELKKTYNLELEKLKKLFPEEDVDEEKEKTDSTKENETSLSSEETEPEQNDNIKVEPKDAEDNEEIKEQTNETEVNQSEANKQQLLVQYLKDTLEFSTLIEEAIPIVCQLLGSTHSSDVLEAIELFVVATEFGLPSAIKGVRQMLLLIWSQEQNIRDAVASAYKRLYMQPSADLPREKAARIVENLTLLANGATIGELSSLQELICEFRKSGHFDGTVIKVLWEKFSKKTQNWRIDDSRLAVLLLSMASGAEVEIIRSNIEVLVSIGFGSDGENDFRLVLETCSALKHLTGNKKLSIESFEEPIRFPIDHLIFTRLTQVLVNGLTNAKNNYWVPMMEKAVSLIYNLADHPDEICENLLKELSQIIVAEKDSENHSATLTRLLATVGQVAFCHLTYLDVHVFTEIKRRQFVQEEKSKKYNINTQKKTLRRTLTPASALMTQRINPDGDNGDDEIGLTGAVADDAEVEYIRDVCEKHVVTGENLLSMYSGVILEICRYPNKYPEDDLRIAAATVLSKFMLISSEFCEDHLQLMFTIMEKSQNEVIRGNTVIAMGDLAFRFPNLMDPWTGHLYRRLRDSSEMVRQNTLTVLTHLILNDMIKVKGQISDIAVCVVDDNEKISDLAKLFFQDLAKKGNAVYNLLPDIISRLSDPEVGIEEENFRKTMKYLLSFIQKDKQLETLIDKLCQRFRATRTDRQARDLAYCLSLFTYNQKCLQKLIDNFGCFGDKLTDEFIAECFATILNNAKKSAKSEPKNIIEDLEAKLEEARTKGLTDESVEVKAHKASLSSKIPGAKKSKTGAKITKCKSRRRDTDDFSDEEITSYEAPPCVSRSRRTKTLLKPALKFDSSDSDEIDEERKVKSEDMSEAPSDLCRSASKSIGTKHR